MNPYIQYMYSYPHKTAYRPLPGVFLKDYMSFWKGRAMGCICIFLFAGLNVGTAIFFL